MMEDNLEKIYNDSKRWIYYDTSEGEVGVYLRCYCGKFLKKGKLFENGLGELKFKGFTCKKCGEVEPYYERI